MGELAVVVGEILQDAVVSDWKTLRRHPLATTASVPPTSIQRHTTSFQSQQKAGIIVTKVSAKQANMFVLVNKKRNGLCELAMLPRKKRHSKNRLLPKMDGWPTKGSASCSVKAVEAEHCQVLQGLHGEVWASQRQQSAVHRGKDGSCPSTNTTL